MLVAMRLRGTPVPIPNTMVKTQAADGTTLETAWESRRPPANLSERKPEGFFTDTGSRETGVLYG